MTPAQIRKLAEALRAAKPTQLSTSSDSAFSAHRTWNRCVAEVVRMLEREDSQFNPHSEFMSICGMRDL